MKKYIIISLLTILVAPSVALASWWNPFTWSIFHRADTKTQVLENSIKKLGSNLKVATTTVTKSGINQPPKIPLKTPTTNSSTSKTERQQETSGTTINPAYLNPVGGLYSPQEVADNLAKQVEDRFAKCATQNKVWDRTMTNGVPNCITHDQSCSNKLPNTVFVKTEDKRTDICNCKTGYVWNSSQTACEIYDPDPYGVFKQGFVYSPEERIAVECATYGTSCPQTSTVQINNYYETIQSSPQTPMVNCSNYQAEKTNLDNYYSQNGTLFSGARASAMDALKARYPGCF